MLDVDGVVVLGRPDGRHWREGLEAVLGLAPQRLAEAFFDPYWPEIVTGRRPLRPALRAALADCAPQVSAETLIDYWFAADAQLNRPLLEALVHLRAAGLQVHLATNQEHERMAHLLQEMGLADHVDAAHHSAALGVCKPDEAFFHRIAARTQLPASAHLLIDDAPRNVEAARRAGWLAEPWQGEGLVPLLARHGWA
ncbi:HAD family hydrolase [Pseudoroseicyclus aestuarii]|nr:HAD-IA family hydrolase [Pseudoroseicyclus aestuarii]